MKRSTALALLLLSAACTGGAPSPGSSGPALSATELKLRVLDKVGGRVFFCGPPVAVSPRILAIRRDIAELHRRPALYRALIAYVHPTGMRLSTADLSRLDRVFGEVESIQLRRVQTGYGFEVTISSGTGGAYQLVSGVVAPSGGVSIERSVTAAAPNCPICLAAAARIATPAGPVPVDELRVGMPVWSTDRSGRRIREMVMRTVRRPVWPGSELVLVVLADGRTVLVSSGHPTPGGRLVGMLRSGDRVDGTRIASVRRIPYRGFTYDLLPSGPTGTYFADGILLGSTLSR